MTGQIDSKFGVGIENGEAYDIIAKAAKMENIEVVGIHCHIGSQIFGLEPFMKTAEVMINFIADIRDKLNIQLNELNLGGGFGIRYTEKDAHLEYDKFVESVSKVVKKVANEKGIKELFILIEPGRSIVGSAGITLYEVGNVKNIEGIRKYISVDGGMCDNPRYALYESEYTALLANKPKSTKDEVVTIAGKCCESGDLIAKDIKMPKTQAGDIIAVLATGAYNYSMAMNYNRLGKPPVVLVKDGKIVLLYAVRPMKI